MTDFEQFCASVCALAGVDVPALAPDAQGAIGFTVTHEGLEIGFRAREGGAEPSALLMVPFGLPPAGREREALQAVMTANSQLLAPGAPVFVRHPASGSVVLHQELALAQLDGPTLCRCIANAVEVVRLWEEGGAFTSSDEATCATAPLGLVHV